MAKRSSKEPALVVGIDLGDRTSEVCVMNRVTGDVLERSQIRTTEAALRQRFGSCERMRVAMETGTHSPWVSRVIEECGHEAVVANARRLKCISDSDTKSDRADAQWLARLVRADVRLLAPVKHRGAKTQADLEVLRARGAMVRARSLLVNHVRGAVKSAGSRLTMCAVESFPRKGRERIPEALVPALAPVLAAIERLNEEIHGLDKSLLRIAREEYPEHELMTQVSGVGPVTAMSFLLTIEDPRRFQRNRDVGAYLGMVPRRSQSGKLDPQMRITKAGDREVRRLLVMAAHYILGPFGPDTDLRRWGTALMRRGGKNGKKRAVVAVARRLGVLMLSLWKTAEVYEPLRHGTQRHQELPPPVGVPA